jgi:hypothetical protein
LSKSSWEALVCFLYSQGSLIGLERLLFKSHGNWSSLHVQGRGARDIEADAAASGDSEEAVLALHGSIVAF